MKVRPPTFCAVCLFGVPVMPKIHYTTFPCNFPVDGEVGNLLQTCCGLVSHNAIWPSPQQQVRNKLTSNGIWKTDTTDFCPRQHVTDLLGGNWRNGLFLAFTRSIAPLLVLYCCGFLGGSITDRSKKELWRRIHDTREFVYTDRASVCPLAGTSFTLSRRRNSALACDFVTNVTCHVSGTLSTQLSIPAGYR